MTPDDVVRAASTIRSGKRFSLALPFDADGPQRGGFGRFNPIHLMFRDGNDIATGTIVDDFYGGNDRYCRGTDDLIIMPLQSGTQWDSLSHIIFDGSMYNGYEPSCVTSKGATRNDIAQAADRIAGRGVLLDVARAKGLDALEDGYPITADDLDACAQRQGVEVGKGDFVLIRTGHLGARRGDWGAMRADTRRYGPCQRRGRRTPNRCRPPTRGAWRCCRMRRPMYSSRCIAYSSSEWASM